MYAQVVLITHRLGSVSTNEQAETEFNPFQTNIPFSGDTEMEHWVNEALQHFFKHSQNLGLSFFFIKDRQESGSKLVKDLDSKFFYRSGICFLSFWSFH